MALLDQFDGAVPEYIHTETEPLRCINCDEEENVHWGSADSYHGYIARENECNECGTSWTEKYTMEVITNIIAKPVNGENK